MRKDLGELFEIQSLPGVGILVENRTDTCRFAFYIHNRLLSYFFTFLAAKSKTKQTDQRNDTK